MISASASLEQAAVPQLAQGPPWLRDVRKSALQVVRAASQVGGGKPDAAFARAATKTFAVAVAPAGAVKAADLAPFLVPGEGVRMVFLDGLHSPGLSAGTLGRSGRVASLASLAKSNDESLEAHLNRYADPDHPLTALNTLFLQDGALVELAPRAVVTQPIHLLFVHTGQAGPCATYPRVIVLAGEGSQCTIVEQHVGLGTAPSLSDSVVEVVAAPDAVVRHVKVQRDGLRTDHFAGLHIRAEADATVDTFLLSLGAHEAHNEVHLHLEGEGASSTLDGLFLGAGHQRVDCITDVQHSVPHTTSRQLYKGILDGQAHGSFTGMVKVGPLAQKTVAEQTNRNLLLSKEALVATTPQLEINADDVKCSHGSTIGQLDADALFFLRSRGLDTEAARLMLTQAFAREAVDRIADLGIRGLVDALVTAWFTGRRNLQEKGWPQ